MNIIRQGVQTYVMLREGFILELTFYGDNSFKSYIHIWICLNSFCRARLSNQSFSEKNTLLKDCWVIFVNSSTVFHVY